MFAEGNCCFAALPWPKDSTDWMDPKNVLNFIYKGRAFHYQLPNSNAKLGFTR